MPARESLRSSAVDQHYRAPVVIEFSSCHLRGVLRILGRIDGVFARRNLSALFPIEKPTHTTAMKDEYCSLVRATLPVLFVTAGLVLNTTAIA